MHLPNYTHQPNYQSPPPQYGVVQQQQNMYPQTQQYGVVQQQQPPQMMMQQSQYSPQYQQSNMQQLPQYGVVQQQQQPSMYQQQQPQQYQPQMILPQSTTQQSLYQQQQQQPQQQMMHSSYMVPQQQQQQPQMMIPQQVYQQPQQMMMQQTTLYEKPMTQVQFVQQTTMPPPINQNMMQAMRLVAVEEAAKEWYKKRVELLALLETMVKGLDKKQKSSAKAKIGGTATNIVGASLIVGGIIAAPFTLGGSLLATGAGLGCVGAGTTTTVVASVMEWKHAKKTALLVQELLQKDTQSVNDMIKKIYEYRLNDPYIETRTITIGTCAVNVVQFVEALVSFRNQGLDSTGGLTNGNAGVVSLASLMIKGTIPIISIPVDMVLLVEESKKAHGKEPSKLALKILPIMDGIKMQTQRATGNFM